MPKYKGILYMENHVFFLTDMQKPGGCENDNDQTLTQQYEHIRKTISNNWFILELD